MFYGLRYKKMNILWALNGTFVQMHSLPLRTAATMRWDGVWFDCGALSLYLSPSHTASAVYTHSYSRNITDPELSSVRDVISSSSTNPCMLDFPARVHPTDFLFRCATAELYMHTRESLYEWFLLTLSRTAVNTVRVLLGQPRRHLHGSTGWWGCVCLQVMSEWMDGCLLSTPTIGQVALQFDVSKRSVSPQTSCLIRRLHLHSGRLRGDVGLVPPMSQELVPPSAAICCVLYLHLDPVQLQHPRIPENNTNWSCF